MLALHDLDQIFNREKPVKNWLKILGMEKVTTRCKHFTLQTIMGRDFELCAEQLQETQKTLKFWNCET